MASIPPDEPGGWHVGRLVGIVATLIVVVVVFGVLLFHFAGGGGSANNNVTNHQSPGPAQPAPTYSPTPGGQH